MGALAGTGGARLQPAQQPLRAGVDEEEAAVLGAQEPLRDRVVEHRGERLFSPRATGALTATLQLPSAGERERRPRRHRQRGGAASEAVRDRATAAPPEAVLLSHDGPRRILDGKRIEVDLRCGSAESACRTRLDAADRHRGRPERHGQALYSERMPIRPTSSSGKSSSEGSNGSPVSS